MSIQPVFDSVRTNRSTEINEQVKVETKTDIPSESVLRVLDVRAFCGGVSTAEEDKGAAGTVIFNVIYASAEGVKKYECAQNFSKEISAQGSVKLCVKTEKAVADVSGTMLSLSAVVVLCGRATESQDTPFLSGGENVVVDESTITVQKSLGVKRATFPAESEKTVPYEIAEVLYQQAAAYVSEVQCGVGSIICDGEVNFSALLLQNSENGDIIKEETAFPFRYELECDEAMPSNLAKAEVSVRSVRSDIAVDAESGKSTATVRITIDIDGEAFTEETKTVVKDAFSIAEKTEIERCCTIIPAYCGRKTVKTKVSGKTAVGVAAGGEIIAAIKESAEIVSVKCEKTLTVKGVYSEKVFYKDADGKVGSFTAETPFEYKEEKEDAFCRAEIKAYALSPYARAVSESETEIGGEIALSIDYIKNEKAEFISDIRAVGEKDVNNAAISVYIPLEGEGLFSLAKRLNVSPESLVSTNKELNFPLSGKERIVIYRQK